MKIYRYADDRLEFGFRQSVERFFVEEIPLEEAEGDGPYLRVKILKRDMSTARLISVISKATGASNREIGYGGLKDKSATTIQHITLPIGYEADLSNIKTQRIEILSIERCRKAMHLGRLAGNRFEITIDAGSREIEEFRKRLQAICDGGFPNYFGYQRFGERGDSWKQGRDIAHSGKRLRGDREKLLVASWQSRLFNEWLEKRVYISSTVDRYDTKRSAKKLGYPIELVEVLRNQPQFYKLFIGEAMMSRRGIVHTTDLDIDSRKFISGTLRPTGLLPGAKAVRAYADARYLEEPYDDSDITSLPGSRRVSWVYAKDCEVVSEKGTDSHTVSFTLPPGSYATVLLEEIAGGDISGRNYRK